MSVAAAKCIDIYIFILDSLPFSNNDCLNGFTRHKEISQLYQGKSLSPGFGRSISFFPQLLYVYCIKGAGFLVWVDNVREIDLFRKILNYGRNYPYNLEPPRLLNQARDGEMG